MTYFRVPFEDLEEPKLRLRWMLSLCLAAILLTTGCSLKRMAVNEVADAMASAGGTVQSDDDPDLIRDAAPFQLKMLEALLAENPEHEGLLLAAASGFTQYAYAFIQQEADEVEDEDLARARELRERARKMYRRAQGYGMRGLDVRHPGFGEALARNPDAAVAGTGQEDVPLLYWTAASWASAIALSKNDPESLADLPLPVALVERALTLDEGFDGGAPHVFFLVYEAGRPGGGTDALLKARSHFARAVELSGGGLASPYLALAESISVKEQNRHAFEESLRTALAIDPDADPSTRLQNMILQKRARWLLGRTDELFVE